MWEGLHSVERTPSEGRYTGHREGSGGQIGGIRHDIKRFL